MGMKNNSLDSYKDSYVKRMQTGKNIGIPLLKYIANIMNLGNNDRQRKRHS